MGALFKDKFYFVGTGRKWIWAKVDLAESGIQMGQSPISSDIVGCAAEKVSSGQSKGHVSPVFQFVSGRAAGPIRGSLHN